MYPLGSLRGPFERAGLAMSRSSRCRAALLLLFFPWVVLPPAQAEPRLPAPGDDVVIERVGIDPVERGVASKWRTYNNVRHAASNLVWYYNPADAPATLPTDVAVATLQSAFARWSASCNLHWSYGGTTTAVPGTRDGTLVVGWTYALGQGGASGWTALSYDYTTIQDADILLNAYWVAAPELLAPVATHEAGHMLGLQHSDVQEAVMAGPPLTSYNGLDFDNTLRSDDIAGCQSLYGAPPGVTPIALPAPPTCYPTANATNPNVGDHVTLTAVCSGGPTSLEWKNCSAGANASTCVATATAPGLVNYQVRGTNGGGTGAFAGVSVNWLGTATPPPSTVAVPQCAVSVASGSATPTVGAGVVLAASCGNAPSAYAWVNCTPMPGDASHCSAAAANAGNVVYSVRAQNGGGWGDYASVALAWQAAAAPPSQVAGFACAGTQSASTATLGQSVALSIACVPSASVYRWTGCASATSTCAASAATTGTKVYTAFAQDATGAQSSVSWAVQWLATAPATPRAVEFYDARLDHYFMTADDGEIAKLDSGATAGWARTGESFPVVPATTPTPTGAAPVCRFYGDPAAGLDSHFYTAIAAECRSVQERFAAWMLESANVFQVYLPDAATGTCPAATRPVYRAFNQRRDANHRYTGDAAIAAAMVARGFVLEGFGDPPVAFCVPAD